MTFQFKGRYTDRPPHIVDRKFSGSDCTCSFCLLLTSFAWKDLTERDKLLWKTHLSVHHGWIAEERLAA